MYDIVEGIHKALRIESTWAFVLVIAIGAALVGGFFAWIIDTGYKNSAEYKAEHPPKQQTVTASSPASQNVTVQGTSTEETQKTSSTQPADTLKKGAKRQVESAKASKPTAEPAQQAPRSSTPAPSPPKPFQDNSVHIGEGAKVDQNSNGLCSPNIVGGSSTVNCGPPPIHIKLAKLIEDFIDKNEDGETVPSKFKYNKEVTVTVDGPYTPVSIAVLCNAPIAEVSSFLRGNSMKLNYLDTIGTDGKTAIVYFEGQAATPDNPIIVRIRSNSPFSVLSVVKARLKKDSS